ncbi:hypothetical protein EJB05_22385 [Eragrostis curvula]|uniref:Pollen Ole e 1 allergen and extensin family protein n=1 Tax=Eragrostis curvula TaxID=38414 RepID=A0A5J9V5G2_9POAL|nr:hypothetical protein EJB05_22385 [Eragrostis curvula]
MLRRSALAVLLLPVLLLFVASAAEEALPMELYFSPAELARIAGYGEEPVSSVTVSGQVTCELCLRPGSDLLAFELPGTAISNSLDGLNKLEGNESEQAKQDTRVVSSLSNQDYKRRRCNLLWCRVAVGEGSGFVCTDVIGAKVAVICESEGRNQVDSSAFATTDEYGNFTIDLPSQLHATPNLEKACTVKVLQFPVESSCQFAYHTRSTYGLSLSSVEDGIRTYTTGVIRLQHSNISSDKCVNVGNRSQIR